MSQSMQLAELYSSLDGWRKTRIDALATPIRKLIDPAKIDGEEVLHISIPAFDEGGEGQLQPSSLIGSHKLWLHGGEILIARLNPRKSRVTIVPHRQMPILASTEFIALEPQAGCEPRFLAWMLRSQVVRQWLDSQVKSVTRSHQRVDSQALTQAQIWVPTHDEQRRIADFLDRETAHIDALSTRKRQLLSVLGEKRAAIGQAAVSGHLTSGQTQRIESHLPWLPMVPSHWRIPKLSFVARLGTGHTPSRSKTEYWETERDIPWLTTSDIERFRDDRCDILEGTKESISRIGLENSSAELHPAGTVALSRTASVGFSVVMGRDMATSQDFATWTCSESLEPRFLLLCLRAMRTDLQKRLATGSTHKTIYMPEIQSLRIPLPPIDEQRQAVELAREQIEHVDELSDLIRRQLPLLDERRDALITAAVTGELDPSTYRGSAVAA